MKKELVYFVAIPVMVYTILIGFYFSGVHTLQQIVAPTIEGMASNSWREFGLLEQLQNLLLLAAVVILALAAARKNNTLDRVALSAGVLVFLFLLLEEIDYGLHFYEFITGHNTGIENRNWHNQRNDGEQNVKRSKQIMDVLMFLLFIVLPLTKHKIPIRFIKNIAPSRWYIAGFATCIAMSNIAHLLDDQSFAMIDGVEGNLSGNISEFRELGNYYFFMHYALKLLRLESIFGNNNGKPGEDDR